MANAPRINTAEYTVSELSAALKRTVEDAYGHVRLRGEISGYRGPHSSGHCYFALKDESARIEAVIWKGQFGRLRMKPEEGMEVVATGRLTTYPGTSKYQIVIETLELAGVGALMALMEKRRQQFVAEGLFDPARKQLLPFLPDVIGVVTSPTGAVIRDILHRLADRFPRHVLVWPVRVQGEGAAEQIAAAIAGFNALPAGGAIPRPDVLIVARGGGSLEDLWCFNEEVVVRAAAASDIPLISAVGHETDTTLIDFAADMRAPTPTAAAEMAVPVRLDLLARVNDVGRRALAIWLRCQEARRSEWRAAARALPTPDRLLAVPRQRIDAAAGALPRALIANARLHERALSAMAARLNLRLLRARLAQEQSRLDAAGQRHVRGLPQSLRRQRERFTALDQRLSASLRATFAAHRTRLGHDRTRLDRLAQSAARAMAQIVTLRRARMDAAGSLLAALSYRGVLARGYAVIRDEAGAPLRAAQAVAAQNIVQIELADGIVRARPDAAGTPAPPAPRKPREAPPAPPQRGLFDP